MFGLDMSAYRFGAKAGQIVDRLSTNSFHIAYEMNQTRALSMRAT